MLRVRTGLSLVALAMTAAVGWQGDAAGALHVASVRVGALTLTPSVLVASRATPGVALGYLTVRNTGGVQEQVLAASSPAAASVLWRTTQRVVTSETLFTAGEACSDTPADAQDDVAQSTWLDDLVVGPHASMTLAPETGSLVLTGISGHLGHSGSDIPITFYLADGSQLTARFPLET